MGRFKKEILNKDGIDIRDVGYYSTPSFIANYISEELIKLNPNGRKALDPAVGKEELLPVFIDNGITIDSYDIVNYNCIKRSNFTNKDFILHYINEKTNIPINKKLRWDYDYYIANPPYNCHEIKFIKEHKLLLKNVFAGVGANNMYSLFLSAMIDVAKDGSLIGVIISDSFLTAKAHSGLRQQILNNCAIHQLLLCPTSLFSSQKADVRTCIIILQKGTSYQKQIKILNRPESLKHLEDALRTKNFKEVDLSDLMLPNSKSGEQFIIDAPADIISLFSNPRIKDQYKCVTGISTGNDKKYLSKDKKEGFNIPFYKNPGKSKFYSVPDAYIIDDYIDESRRVKDFMVRNKNLMGTEGITCSSMGIPFSTCYLPPNVTFGVNASIFPKKEDIFWLISYLNSSLVTYFVRGVLTRSNMITSGYVSQIPLLDFDLDVKSKLSVIACDVLNGKLQQVDAIKRIDLIVNKSAKISIESVKLISDFSEQIQKKV